jgi:hypothetical protein
VYGIQYSDGYGLNFYTREYGYYEYCNSHEKKAISVFSEGEGGGVLGLVLSLVITCVVLSCGIYCCFCKNKDEDDVTWLEATPGV